MFDFTFFTRSSIYFGSIGNDAVDLNSSVFDPCQMPSNVFFIDLLC
jgi:hypothetical protein